MTTPTPRSRSELLTPAEVADAFRVSPKTVARWANSGLLPAMRTLGGHRRFRRADVEAALAAVAALDADFEAELAVDSPVPYTPTDLAAVAP